MLTMLLSGTVPFSVVTSSAWVDESTVTLVTLAAISGVSFVLVRPSLEAAAIVYCPAGAAAPLLVVPFHVKFVSPEVAGATWKVLTSAPLELVTLTVTLLAPDAADTAPVTVPPLESSVAVVLGARTVWPSIEAPLAICVDCRLVCRPDSEVCIDCMLDTWLICSSWLRNCVGSLGCSGFWSFNCVVMSVRKSAGVMFSALLRALDELLLLLLVLEPTGFVDDDMRDL